MLFSHSLTPKHPLCAGYRSKHGDTEGGKVEPSFVELMFSWRESEADRQLSNRVILICQVEIRSGEKTKPGRGPRRPLGGGDILQEAWK